MTSSARALFADYAWLPEGWRRDVLLQWDERGILNSVAPEVAPPARVPRAAGPLLPGMPNLHSHAFQRAMAGLTEYRASGADNFWSWRDLVYRFAARITPDGLAAIARWLYIEMLKAGYTSVCEFHYLHHAADGSRYGNPAELAERVVDAAQAAGIGMTMLPVLYQFGGFGERAPLAGQQRYINTPDRLLELLEALRQARPASTGLRYGVAPHSLRAVSAASLHDLLAGLDSMLPGAPIHIHIAEQTGEVDECVRLHGARPVRWLLERFAVDSRWCLVHATHVDVGETVALAHSGATAGLCLTTEANLGDGLFPGYEYLAADGAFGIGSDSHIGVDWRAELRLFEYGQRLVRRQRNVLSTEAEPHVADRLFAAALRGGAAAAGRAIGALEAGCRADWITLDPNHPSIAEHAPGHWLSGMVFCEHGESPIRDVTVGGECMVQARRHRDETAAYAGYRAALAELLG
jgi:formimidoylglutamate deiminase